jgi:predicted DNA-binding protein
MRTSRSSRKRGGQQISMTIPASLAAELDEAAQEQQTEFPSQTRTSLATSLFIWAFPLFRAARFRRGRLVEQLGDDSSHIWANSTVADVFEGFRRRSPKLAGRVRVRAEGELLERLTALSRYAGLEIDDYLRGVIEGFLEHEQARMGLSDDRLRQLWADATKYARKTEPARRSAE